MVLSVILGLIGLMLMCVGCTVTPVVPAPAEEVYGPGVYYYPPYYAPYYGPEVFIGPGWHSHRR